MPSFAQVFEVQLRQFSPEEAQRRHVAIARGILRRYVSAKPEGTDYSIYTDGNMSSTETTVKPFGVIEYRFSDIREIVARILTMLRTMGQASNEPLLTGRYRGSWFAMVGGKEVRTADIRPGDVVTIVNDQPYSRKINVGAKGYKQYVVPNSVIERARQFAIKKHGRTVSAEIVFMTLAGGYVLKNDQYRIRNGRRSGGPRRDARRGSVLTYPALQLTPKFDFPR